MPERTEPANDVPPAAQPFRAVFLARFKPEHSKVFTEFGDLLESAALEALSSTEDDEPFNLVMSRATLADLEALQIHQRDTVETWSHTQNDTSPKLRTAMQRVHGLLLEAEDLLREALDEEARQAHG